MSPTGAISRRTLLAGLVVLPLATACSARGTQSAAVGPQDGPQITVYKSPT